MSGGLCPSRSTVYIGNLPFSLTNNDLHKILEKYGNVVKVTMVKDKETHKSTGVAFVLFLDKESAQKCVRALNRRQLFGRTLKCNIAQDNGRAPEFIRRKDYKDKSRCYECGELGHLSYHCPKNMLGDREPVKKEKKKRKFEGEGSQHESGEESEEEVGEDPGLESLSAAIRYQDILKYILKQFIDVHGDLINNRKGLCNIILGLQPTARESGGRRIQIKSSHW